MCQNNIKEEKKQLREEYKRLRRSIPRNEKIRRDKEICKRFLSLSSYRYADEILLYSPLEFEIDTSDIFSDALSKGKKVAFPRCVDGNRMIFHYTGSPDQLVPGAFGIKEPLPDLPVYSGGKVRSVCVFPAIVFDKKGYRVGYGKGYYDRFLSDFSGVKVGLVYSDFIITEVPRGKYDLRTDVIVTEKGVVSFAEN